MSVYEIAACNRDILYPLFNKNQFDTVIAHSVLEGYCGTSIADSERAPTVARLDSGAFTIFGGNPKAKAAQDLMRHDNIAYVTPESSQWKALLQAEYGDALHAIQFTEFDARSLDVGHLSMLANGLTNDLSGEFQFRQLSGDLLERLEADLENEYFYEHFDSVEDILSRGLGCFVLHEGVIVSAATSTAKSRRAIDIEIETTPAFRKRGLATNVGARLALLCLEREIRPKWLAANMESARLAEILGYTKANVYSTFEVVADSE